MTEYNPQDFEPDLQELENASKVIFDQCPEVVAGVLLLKSPDGRAGGAVMLDKDALALMLNVASRTIVVSGPDEIRERYGAPDRVTRHGRLPDVPKTSTTERELQALYL